MVSTCVLECIYYSATKLPFIPPVNGCWTINCTFVRGSGQLRLALEPLQSTMMCLVRQLIYIYRTLPLFCRSIFFFRLFFSFFVYIYLSFPAVCRHSWFKWRRSLLSWTFQLVSSICSSWPMFFHVTIFCFSICIYVHSSLTTHFYYKRSSQSSQFCFIWRDFRHFLSKLKKFRLNDSLMKTFDI